MMVPHSASPPAGRLANQVVLITGGAKGCGEASARLFAEEGAHLALVDIDAAAGEALAAELQAAGHPVLFLAADVGVPEQAAAAVAAALARFGRIDALFNHAGTLLIRPFLEMSLSEWQHVLDQNLTSAFQVSRLVLPGMLQRGHGTLLFTSSSGAKVITPLESAYCASKAGMSTLAKAIAVEFRDRGIRSNALLPSFVRTEHGLREIAQLRSYGVLASEQDVKVLQGRICEPEEVAQAALFLLSEASSFINGAEISIDNSFTAV